MATKKVLSGELVVSLLDQMLKSQDEFRTEMRQSLDRLRVEVVSEQRQTNERLDRLEKATVGVGRMISLEERMRRVEERVGIDPPTDR